MPEEKPKVPTTLKAAYDEGEIKSKEFPSLPEQCGSHAPLLIAAGSFCQLFIEKAPEEYMTVKNLVVTAYSSPNVSAYYRRDHDRDATDPWKTIKLDVHVETDTSEMELKMFKDTILKRYAAREVNDEHFAIAVAIQVDDIEDIKEDVPKLTSKVDYEAYEGKGKGTDPITVDQKVECAWADDNPDVITTTFDNTIVVELSSKENVAIEDSKLPTPIQAYLFGLLHQFMSCMVMRMASRDLGLTKFEGDMYTILMNGNKNYDDGLDPLVFDINGGKMDLDIVGHASKDKVQFAFLEAQSMTPSYLTASGMCETNCKIVKL